jgi:hypothetical protein
VFSFDGLREQPDDSRPAMAVLSFRTSPAGLLHHFYRLDPAARNGGDIEFLAIIWRLGPRDWLARAKVASKAAVYGTEGQRFESSRARSRSRVDAGIFVVLTFGLRTEAQVLETADS